MKSNENDANICLNESYNDAICKLEQVEESIENIYISMPTASSSPVLLLMTNVKKTIEEIQKYQNTIRVD
jgi:hypothetical protein